MKNCYKCKISKDEHEFYKKGPRYDSWCKQCLNNYQAARWNKNKTILVKEKGGKCEECGRTGHPAIFDFHHRNPNEKDFTISHMRVASLAKLRIEITKCDLLCSCCHRLKHISDIYWQFNDDELIPKPRSKPKPKCYCGKTVTNGTRYCSPTCNSKAQEKTNWPDNLPELVQKTSKLQVAKQLGVSDKAVAKRLKNHHSNPSEQTHSGKTGSPSHTTRSDHAEEESDISQHISCNKPYGASIPLAPGQSPSCTPSTHAIRSSWSASY